MAYWKSLESALRWAFGGYGHGTAQGTLGQWVGDTKGGAKRQLPDPDLDRLPTGLDAVAQAGMILGYIRDMKKQRHRFHFVALYGRGHERVDAQRKLCGIFYEFIDIEDRQLVYELIARYYGKKTKLVDLARRFDRHPNTLTKYIGVVNAILNDAAAEADDVALVELRERGVIL